MYVIILCELSDFICVFSCYSRRSVHRVSGCIRHAGRVGVLEVERPGPAATPHVVANFIRARRYIVVVRRVVFPSREYNPHKQPDCPLNPETATGL